MPDGDDVRVGENKTGHKATSITAVNPYNESAIFKTAPEGSNVDVDIDGVEGNGCRGGAGVKAIGGKRGPGVQATGGADLGAGVRATGGANRGVGVQATGGGDRGIGVQAIGGNSGVGVQAKGGIAATGVSSIGGAFVQSPGMASTPGMGVRAEGGPTNVSPASAASQREGHAPGLLALAGRITIRPSTDPNVDVKLPPSQSVSLNGYTNVGAFGLGAAQEEVPTATSDAGDVIILGSPFPGAGLVGQGGGIRRWIGDPSEAAGGHWENVPGNGGAGVVGVSGGAAVPNETLQSGVGGVFTAHRSAQIRLLPTLPTNDPNLLVDGEAGDLLATISPDGLAELWFLQKKGNQNWKKIA
ncbi:hypothetical protein IFM12275_40530 [Nocardia sputorum]|uniref:hypothetical protein n=1 Tax=Nocardia sputorum TaxID=2984338 RepID=UPI0024924410|nr:hypothetical protein [Nocardia sputorum]BDT94077.1 hypothetical protein IFM12275_40530 [Nocardia sputorum]